MTTQGLSWLTAIFCALATCVVSADSLSYRQGTEIMLNGAGTGVNYSGAQDVELRGAEPTTNFDTGSGSNEFTLDGSDGGSPTHVAIRFDAIFGSAVHSVPLGAQIDSATLTLSLSDSGDDFQVYQLAPDVVWDEQTASWNQFGPSVNNGIHVGVDTTGAAITASGVSGVRTIDVTPIVQAWSQGETNNGFGLVPGGSNGLDFDSSESATLGNRPALAITFSSNDPNAPVFSQDSYTYPDARSGHPYTGTLTGLASDLDGDPLAFSKANGPEWLHIANDGTLSGTPGNVDMGTNRFTIAVADNDEGSDIAVLEIAVNDENGNPLPGPSQTARYRLVWLDDPSTTMIVAWDQVTGADATVFYGPADNGRAADAYPYSKTADRAIAYRGMNNRFAHLSGLEPDTTYFFVLRDDAGVSERFSFRTAPATPQPFTFIAGGDSRNNRTPRQYANQLVAKLRPLFVAFTGDMISSDNDEEWLEWMDDWQQTISADGRMYPLLPHRGNHETGGNSTIFNLFDTTQGNYYGISFGGTLLRFYVLNSESAEESQTGWLQNDLNTAGGKDAFTHLCAGYHKPMRPHTSSKSEGSSEYSAWSGLFYDNSFDLIFESDSHMMKRTFPLRPFTGSGSEEGFVRDDLNGTTFIGEGCWGAPLRDADDAKGWTAAAGSFNGFDWAHVYEDRIEVFTVQVDTAPGVGALSDDTNRCLPEGIALWQPPSGVRLVVGTRGEAVRDSFAQWQWQHFGPSIQANETATADADGDGRDNLREFAFGLNPNQRDPWAAASLPVVKVSGAQIGILHKRPAASGIHYDYDYSTDLAHWLPMTESQDYTLSTVEQDGVEAVTVQLQGAVAALPTVFIQVKVRQ